MKCPTVRQVAFFLQLQYSKSDLEMPSTGFEDLEDLKMNRNVTLDCRNVASISCPAQDDHFSTIYIIVRDTTVDCQ